MQCYAHAVGIALGYLLSIVYTPRPLLGADIGMSNIAVIRRPMLILVVR